ncbi:MAG: methyltransferase domain-containing protein [Candidatus Thermoplasmatota archaeon]|nr:methyltransferase domain-containing protein [Candidatus Thermoplasmatota archaeon]
MARFDRICHIYDLLPIPTHHQELQARFKGLPGPRLDLGGGTGRFTARLHGEASPQVVADASRGMLAQGRRAERPHHAVEALGEALPFPSSTFHGVSITEAFHHFAPHQAEVLAEVARVLTPQGRLVIEEIHPERSWGRVIAWGENALLRLGSRFLTPGALARMVDRWFEQVTWAPSGSFTYVVEARAPRHP